jgi:hypothetical protein
MRHSLKDRVTLVYFTYSFVHISLHMQLEESWERRSFGELLALLERSKPDFDGKAVLLQRLRALDAWVGRGSDELAAGRFNELNSQSEPCVRESSFLLRRVLYMARR